MFIITKTNTLLVCLSGIITTESYDYWSLVRIIKLKTKQKDIEMERKFNKNDMVGWKSDTDFTKENKNKPTQKIIGFQKCVDGEGWEYRISNYMGWQMQHELELRT